MQPGDQRERGGFAASRGSDQRHRGPGQGLERQAGQARASIRIDEVDVVEDHMAAAGGQRYGVGRVLDGRLLVDDGEDAHHAGQALLQRGVQRSQRA